MLKRLFIILLAINIAIYGGVAGLYIHYASGEIEATENGGKDCADKYAAIRARIQKLIDDYNEKDREAR